MRNCCNCRQECSQAPNLGLSTRLQTQIGEQQQQPDFKVQPEARDRNAEAVTSTMKRLSASCPWRASRFYTSVATASNVQRTWLVSQIYEVDNCPARSIAGFIDDKGGPCTLSKGKMNAKRTKKQEPLCLFACCRWISLVECYYTGYIMFKCSFNILLCGCARR